MGLFGKSSNSNDKGNDVFPHDDLMKRFHEIRFQDPDEAFLILDRVLQISPEDEDAWMFKGDMLRSDKRYEEEIACHRALSGIDPENWNPYLNIGLAYMELGKSTEAIQNFDKAIEMIISKIWSHPYPTTAAEDINNGEYWYEAWPFYWKGVVLSGLGSNNKGAIRCFGQALEMNPGLVQQQEFKECFETASAF